MWERPPEEGGGRFEEVRWMLTAGCIGVALALGLLVLLMWIAERLG